MPADTSPATAHIARLFVYPVKSCAGVEVKEAILTETGLEFDRAWMVVDAEGVFVTQRALPRMALVQPQLKHFDMVLRAPGMLALHVALDAVEAPVTVRVWKDTVRAYDMGDVAAQWFSDFLGQPLRLVRFDPEQRRLSSLEWTQGVEAPNQFSDGYPLLVASEAAMDTLNARMAEAGHGAVGVERFRANLVLGGVAAHAEDAAAMLHIGTGDGDGDGDGDGEGGEVQLQPVKPCTRCPIPNIDPATATSTPAVSQALRQYRRDDRVKGAITFGMNAIVRQGEEQVLRVGQAVRLA